ncbi:hypothetical protein TNCV_845581 [Trichonephila clavipes]|nr:hypothetical protein TNCV_845581 [Trichonephila clavipes]
MKRNRHQTQNPTLLNSPPHHLEFRKLGTSNPAVRLTRHQTLQVKKKPLIAAATVNEKMPENDRSVNVEDTAQTPKISHSEGSKTIETAFKYFKQDASVKDLVFLRCLRDDAAKRRVQCGRHNRTLRTSFF